MILIVMIMTEIIMMMIRIETEKMAVNVVITRQMMMREMGSRGKGL